MKNKARNKNSRNSKLRNGYSKRNLSASYTDKLFNRLHNSESSSTKIPEKLITSHIRKVSENRLKDYNMKIDDMKVRDLINIDFKNLKFPKKRARSQSQSKHKIEEKQVQQQNSTYIK